MTVKAEISVEAERGCGHRKPAKDGVGIYLVGPKTGAPCGRLPFALAACPVCGGGIHAARGWTWIEPRKLFGPPVRACEKRATLVGWSPAMHCAACPMGLGMPEGRHGLVWIGEAHYKCPSDFLAEAHRMGVSRKIKAVPKGFELGKTTVYLAHRFAVPTGAIDDKGQPVMGPGVFSTFCPTGIDLVIADAEKVPEKAEKLAEKYGARVIQVVKAQEAGDQAELPLH
jgi:hypothetical protein